MRVLLTSLVTILVQQAVAQCNPDFSFSVTGNTVNFIDQSTTSQGSIVAYSWNFGDGNVSTLANPVHTYQAPGMYNVRHSVQNSLGTCNVSEDVVMKLVSIMATLYHTTLCPPMASASLYAGSFGSNYQWQLSSDSATYSNLAEGGYYAGVLTSQLQLTNIPSSFTGYRYRCLVDAIPGVPHRLKFVNSWTGSQSNLWSNTANWSCAALPDAYTDVTITSGTLTVDINATVFSLTVQPPATVTVQTGVTLTVVH